MARKGHDGLTALVSLRSILDEKSSLEAIHENGYFMRISCFTQMERYFTTMMSTDSGDTNCMGRMIWSLVTHRSETTTIARWPSLSNGRTRGLLLIVEPFKPQCTRPFQTSFRQPHAGGRLALRAEITKKGVGFSRKNHPQISL